MVRPLSRAELHESIRTGYGHGLLGRPGRPMGRGRGLGLGLWRMLLLHRVEMSEHHWDYHFTSLQLSMFVAKLSVQAVGRSEKDFGKQGESLERRKVKMQERRKEAWKEKG